MILLNKLKNMLIESVLRMSTSTSEFQLEFRMWTSETYFFFFSYLILWVWFMIHLIQ